MKIGNNIITRWLIPGLLLVSTTLSAQFRDMWGTNWNNPVSSFIGSSLYWRNMTRLPEKKQVAHADNKTGIPSKNPAILTFIPSNKLFTSSRLSKAFSSVEKEQAELAGVFEQFLDLFNTKIATGADRFNVASAAAFFMASDYFVATGKEVPDQNVEVLRDALAYHLARHEKYKTFKDFQRQELYESLVIYALLARYGYQEGLEKKDEGQKKRYRLFARECLKAVLGAEPEKMEFSSTGLTFTD